MASELRSPYGRLISHCNALLDVLGEVESRTTDRRQLELYKALDDVIGDLRDITSAPYLHPTNTPRHPVLDTLVDRPRVDYSKVRLEPTALMLRVLGGIGSRPAVPRQGGARVSFEPSTLVVSDVHYDSE